MIIKGIFVKSTKEILFSRSRHDFRSSSDNTVAIDGGFEYTRIVGDIDNAIDVYLDSDIMVKSILFHDYMLGNSDVPEEYKDGYHGRYQITNHSNMEFFETLVVNFKDIEEYL